MKGYHHEEPRGLRDAPPTGYIARSDDAVLPPPNLAAAQTPTAPGVEIDCDDKQPELDVHPLNDPVVEITCTVKKPLFV